MKHENEFLGTEKISDLIKRLSLPAMVGMLVMALYNVVDAVFIGRGVGVLGIAAIAVAFPIQMVVGALGNGIGIGGASVVSRRLGAGKREEANRALGNVITMVIFFGLSFTLGGLVFLKPILRLFGATDGIFPYARDYLSIILFGSAFFAFTMAANNVVRAEGNAQKAMFVMIFSAVINIILDPIFIFGMDMGMRGAAVATIISQVAAAGYLGIYFFCGRSSLSTTISDFVPHFSLMREITAIGLSAFLRQISGSIMFMAVNNMLALYGGDITIAIFGIIHRLMHFSLMPIFGVVQGMQPIVGYNYGANKMQRVSETLSLAIKISTAISSAAFVIMMLFPGYLIRIFSSDPLLIEGGTTAVRIMFAVGFLIGVQMVSGGFYQAIGKARQAFVLTIARQILFLIPLVLILPSYFGVTGVWGAFPLADTCAFVLTMFVFLKDKAKLHTDKVLDQTV